MNVSVLNDEVFKGKNYIHAVDFMNLAASTTKDYIDDIASYLVLNDFDKEISSYRIDKYHRITQVESNQSYDINTRDFLEKCHSHVVLSKHISLRSINDLKGDFYYSYKELESLAFIRKLKLELNFEAARTVRSKIREYDENEIHFIYRKPIDRPEDPNAWQLNYFELKDFDVKTAACLLAGIEVRLIDQNEGKSIFAEIFADYISYKLMFELAIENNEVNFDNGFISSEDLQKYLFNIGYILKGFNDWMRIEPAKPLINVKHDKCQSFDVNNEELARLTQKAADDQATIDKITIEKDEMQSELIKVKAQLEKTLQLQAIDCLKDVPHQSYRTVDRVMYAMAKLSKLDNTEPYSQNNPSLNASITTILQNDGLTLEYQAVGKWLKRINDVKNLTSEPITAPEKLKAAAELKSNV